MAYTPIIQPSDLTTIIYQEKLTAVTRSDTTIIPKAIGTAISEVKSYLGRFNLPAMFGDPVAGTSATYSDEFLNMICKKVTAWHLVQLANVGIDLTLIRTGYEDTIATLKRIQQVKQTPTEWPLLDLTTVAETPGNPVTIQSRRKRHNNF